MYIVAWTNWGNPNRNGTDHWQVAETYDEAQAYITELTTNPSIYCWAIAKIADGSEPHYVLEMENRPSTPHDPSP